MVNRKPTSLILCCLGVQCAFFALALLFPLIHHNNWAFVDQGEINLKYDPLYSLSTSHVRLDSDEITPGAILANGPLSGLTFERASLVFTVLSALGVLIAFLLCARAFFSERKTFLLIALCGVPAVALSYPLWKLLHVGAIDGAAAFLAIGGVFLLRSGNPLEPTRLSFLLDYFAGAALALAASLHPRFAFALIPLLLLRNYKMLIGFFGAALLVLAASPKLWMEYFSYQLHPTPLFVAAENGSFAAIIYTLRNISTFSSSDDALVLASGGMLLFLALLVINLLTDLKRGLPAEREKQAALFATYLPFALTIPANVEPNALVLNAALLPLLGYLWTQSTGRLERAGLITAAIGLALNQAHLFLVAALGFPILQMVPAFGGLILIFGLTLAKVAALLPAIRSARLRFVLPENTERWGYFLVSAGLALFTWIDYARFGFSYDVPLAWFLSIALCCLGFSSRERSEFAIVRFKRRDIIVCAALAVIFLILYGTALYDIPLQLNTDEANVVAALRELMNGPNRNWFGINHGYLNFPFGGFFVLGYLGKLLGGINLEHIRLVSALTGVASILATYLFFRQLWPWRQAAAAAVLMGSCHALLGISRMALPDNAPIFIEGMALTALYCGWQRGRFGLVALGGAISGLGMYGYFTGRGIIAIWMAFLAFYFVLFRSRESLRRAAAIGAVALTGFALSATPMLIASEIHSRNSFPHFKYKSVLYPEGRDLLRDWEGTSDTSLAFARNFARGITMFNNNADDHGNIYKNPGYGIIDPLSGVLLWIGVIAVARRRRSRAGEILICAGLITIWIPVSIIMNKAPCYSRFLVIMPFPAYLVFHGARIVAWRFSALLSAFPSRRLRGVVLTSMISVVCAWNGWIYYVYVRRGLTEGEFGGNSARFAHKRSEQDRKIYVCTDNRHPYFWFGGDAWRFWIECCMRPEHRVELVRPSVLLDPSMQPMLVLRRPCTVFMSGDMWKKTEKNLRNEVPDLQMFPMSKENAQVAVDLP